MRSLNKGRHGMRAAWSRPGCGATCCSTARPLHCIVPQQYQCTCQLLPWPLHDCSLFLTCEHTSHLPSCSKGLAWFGFSQGEYSHTGDCRSKSQQVVGSCFTVGVPTKKFATQRLLHSCRQKQAIASLLATVLASLKRSSAARGCRGGAPASRHLLASQRRWWQRSCRGSLPTL